MLQKNNRKIRKIRGEEIAKTSFNIPVDLLRRFGMECKGRGESQASVVIHAMNVYTARRPYRPENPNWERESPHELLEKILNCGDEALAESVCCVLESLATTDRAKAASE